MNVIFGESDLIQRYRFFVSVLVLLSTIPHMMQGAVPADKKSPVHTTRPSFKKTENRVQQFSDVIFESKNDHYTTYFTPSGMIIAGFTRARAANFTEPPQYFEVEVLLRNALPNVEVTTLNPRLARSDFFGSESPSWLTHIPDYAKVKYSNLYPDVDMVFQTQKRQLEFDFIIAPGADPKKIRFEIRGAQDLHVTSEGALLVNIHDVIFELPKPKGYQAFDSSSARSVIDVRYVLTAKNEVGFELAAYNLRRTLIIDR